MLLAPSFDWIPPNRFKRLGSSAKGHPTVKMLCKLFNGGRKEASEPDYSFLHAQIIATIEMLLRVRGSDWLLQPETAIVMRNDYGVFLTQNDIDGVDNRQNALAFVYLKQMEFHDEFKTIQADPSLRIGPLGQMAVNYLADQLAKDLLKQAAAV